MSVAIRVENLSKYYRLGAINHGMLYKDIQSWLARKRGKPDPHGQIGADHFADRPEGFWALKDLNFDIQQGDRVGIIGKNGAGKSTLLKILSRITAPTEGIIKIKGRVTSLLEVGTGFHGELTGRENIYLNGAILGMKRREIDKKIDEIIDFSEIEQHIDTPVKRYSSGMYVRLAFAVAAHLDSEILIADEVLAVGDAAFQKKALGKMQDLSSEQGKTVLFVSHQMIAVSSLCNRGIVLERGRNILQDDISTCIDKYLSENSASLSYGYWEGAEGSQDFTLTKAYLSNKDGEIFRNNRFAKGDTVYLGIEYTVINYLANLVLSVEFLNKDGVKLCVNSATDYFKEGDRNKLTNVGTHSIMLAIDTGIFATGKYHIRFDFAIHSVKRIITDTPSLSFEIASIASNIQQLSPARENVIYPSWKWEYRY